MGVDVSEEKKTDVSKVSLERKEERTKTWNLTADHSPLPFPIESPFNTVFLSFLHFR